MTDARTDDLAGTAGRTLAIWGVPIAALVASLLVVPTWNVAVWPAALAWMGTACLWNARRCGRVHCHFTGPFYLGLAVVALLHGLAVLPLGPAGWYWLLGALAIGRLALYQLPERAFGRHW